MIEIITDIEKMRQLSMARRSEGFRVGLVPTMGSLHEGHLSLVKRANDTTDFVVVSIFVNPIQFGHGEDFNRYPRDIESDMRLLETVGAHVIFAPDKTLIYPPGYSSYVLVERLTEGLCGCSRPGHFRGVTTVVIKLFNIVMPHVAVFGQKDAQQLAVIKRMTKDLNMDIEIDVGPTIREPDGLAMSSRNSYLNQEERQQATVLYKALCTGEKLVKSDVINSQEIIKKVREVFTESPLAKIEYIEIVGIEDMMPVDDVSGGALLAIALWFSTTRLIDNIVLSR